MQMWMELSSAVLCTVIQYIIYGIAMVAVVELKVNWCLFTGPAAIFGQVSQRRVCECGVRTGYF